MPVEVKDLHGGVGVSITGRGVVTEKEYVDAFERYLAQDNQKLEKYRYCLADWTAVSKVEISTEAIEYIAWLSKNALTVNPDIVIASVADQDIMFGLTRMAHALRNGTDCENEVFQDRQDAEEWIREKVKKYGIDDPEFS